MFRTQHLKVWGAKNISNHDFWRHFEKGREPCLFLSFTVKEVGSVSVSSFASSNGGMGAEAFGGGMPRGAMKPSSRLKYV